MMRTRTAPRTMDSFLTDVLVGLSCPQKRLPSKYFYDAAGSRLFDRITELAEYYPTRAELAIMRAHADAMAARCGPQCLLVELGAGSLVKVRLLLDQLNRPAGYVPVDVSGDHLRGAARELAADYPSLGVYPVVADFTRPFWAPSVPAARRVVYFPGSTIGNFDPSEADQLLRRVMRLIGPGGGLILGLDLRKAPAMLEPAYNDAQGVTAAFNRNLLVRINSELGADFDPAAFRHRAYYNRERSRIEMHLVSTAAQRVRVGDATFAFLAGESIHTENSYKYDLADFARRVAECGLRADETWTDENGYFAVLYLTAVSGLSSQRPIMPKATWNGAVLAESDKTIVIAGNHYFPAGAIRTEYFRPTATHTICGWKGTASYYTIEVDGKQNTDAAWYYPKPKNAAKQIAGYVAFGKGVKVEG
jgi:L-histidine N-alpha-methyltransferase